MQYEFKTKLWEYRPKSPGQQIGLWVFVSVPQKYYDEIKELAGPHKKGFGSVRVEVTIGNTTWKTSIFPDTKSGAFVLPVKKKVRTDENIAVGDHAQVTIKLLDL